ncbi:hypothetical protein LY28_02863 [Ruminiclostridium sufflavum DSM 19573]|uniref:Uncharacterized protein n=1 Tax=Ruminiclostridium sufflavum DSM 19573 TaxID=1121337 RepID=A0A318XHZ4_9FIRM|nr:hypothetical protein [Ruminiclostridium sufflavum]PYG86644.1 hypothetical protein LY28_02863 [Ruminiclostridium sufflavum DSM 19573]
MNTFFRYFIHFLLVSFIILAAIGGVGFFSKLPMDIKVVTAVIFSALLFSICMSAIFSNFLAHQEHTALSFETEKDKSFKLDEIKKISTGILKKEELQINSAKYVFTEKSGYSRWLTNPIEINIDSNLIRITTPKAYIPYFNKLNKN